eukprot:m.306789 g.306789  ORF g.306789 m.306789 type:complete len:110 (-) comp27369_c0_seq3:2654-2983(-)
MSTWPWGDWGGQNSKGQNGEASSQPGPLLSSEPDKMLNGHTSTVWAVAFSPTGHRLASGSADASVKLWDPADGQCVATLTHPLVLGWRRGRTTLRSSSGTPKVHSVSPL